MKPITDEDRQEAREYREMLALQAEQLYTRASGLPYLKYKLVLGVSFTNANDGERRYREGCKSEVGVVQTGTDASSSGRSFHFYEGLDKVIPEADKQRIANALADLFKYAADADEIDQGELGFHQ